MSQEDFAKYLPKYLSEKSQRELFASLKDFPKNIDSRIFTTHLKETNIVYQGDALDDLLVVNLPDTDVQPVRSLVLSNTCDIDPGNEKNRNFSSNIIYAPILNLNKYRKGLISKLKKSEQEVDDHIAAIKSQRITQVLYLPEFGSVLPESIVFLDRICNSPSKLLDRKTLNEKRVLSLSNYGFYLLLFKLSIHFTRIQENVERGYSL